MAGRTVIPRPRLAYPPTTPTGLGSQIRPGTNAAAWCCAGKAVGQLLWLAVQLLHDSQHATYRLLLDIVVVGDAREQRGRRHKRCACTSTSLAERWGHEASHTLSCRVPLVVWSPRRVPRKPRRCRCLARCARRVCACTAMQQAAAIPTGEPWGPQINQRRQVGRRKKLQLQHSSAANATFWLTLSSLPP